MSEENGKVTAQSNNELQAEKKYFFDKPRNVKLTLIALYILCGITLVFEFFVNRHLSHPWEQLFGFHALYGFVVCISLVLAAKELRKLLIRQENYYDGEDDV